MKTGGKVLIGGLILVGTIGGIYVATRPAKAASPIPPGVTTVTADGLTYYRLNQIQSLGNGLYLWGYTLQGAQIIGSTDPSTNPGAYLTYRGFRRYIRGR